MYGVIVDEKRTWFVIPASLPKLCVDLLPDLASAMEMYGRPLLYLLFALLCVQQSQGRRDGGEGMERQLHSLRPKERSLIGSTEPWVEPISWSPRAFIYHNFLSHEEADHIVSIAKPWMKRSTVVGNKGQSVLDPIRTSYGMFIKRLQDPVIARVEQKVAEWTHLNISYQEDMQILRYGLGQKYGAHWDSIEREGSPRIATVLLYLNDVEEGGETAFPGPEAEWVDPSLPERLGPFGPCAEGHVAATPKKGDALLFFSLLPSGGFDKAALHTGCPVLKGVKWTATKWIHTKPFRPQNLGKEMAETVRPEECLDLNDNCEVWAKAGECERNKGFMLGDGGSLGQCKLSCGACEQCQPNDLACMTRNRVNLGYLPMEEIM